MKRNDWVAKLNSGSGNCPQIAKVKTMHGTEDADLIFYSHTGDCIGRSSPAMGGPKNFEPFCSTENWVVIKTPNFEELALTRSGWGHLLERIGGDESP